MQDTDHVEAAGRRDDIMASDGWAKLPAHGFIDLVGPFWWRERGNDLQMSAWMEARHENQAGVVQGGMIATLADRAMGFASRRKNPPLSQATISLEIKYMSPAPIGELLVATCRVTRMTRHIAFLQCELMAGDTLAATANGLFKRRPA